jgi:hypothetical protein
MTEKKKKKTKYPWDKWFAKSTFRLVQGKHFTCQMHGMAQQIRNVAAARGIPVSIQFKEECLKVKVG